MDENYEKWLKACNELEPSIDPEKEPYTIGFLMAAAILGTVNPDRIAKLTKYPRFYCREKARAARGCGVFEGRLIKHSGWFDDKSGGVAFIMDCATIDGLMERSGRSERSERSERSS